MKPTTSISLPDTVQSGLSDTHGTAITLRHWFSGLGIAASEAECLAVAKSLQRLAPPTADLATKAPRHE